MLQRMRAVASNAFPAPVRVKEVWEHQRYYYVFGWCVPVCTCEALCVCAAWGNASHVSPVARSSVHSALRSLARHGFLNHFTLF
jgi:hypothetical protein